MGTLLANRRMAFRVAILASSALLIAACGGANPTASVQATLRANSDATAIGIEHLGPASESRIRLAGGSCGFLTPNDDKTIEITTIWRGSDVLGTDSVETATAGLIAYLAFRGELDSAERDPLLEAAIVNGSEAQGSVGSFRLWQQSGTPVVILYVTSACLSPDSVADLGDICDLVGDKYECNPQIVP